MAWPCQTAGAAPSLDVSPDRRTLRRPAPARFDRLHAPVRWRLVRVKYIELLANTAGKTSMAREQEEIEQKFYIALLPDRTVKVQGAMTVGGFVGRPLTISGPGTVDFPKEPMSRADFYTQMAQLAKPSFWDSLLA